jgi:hypothetical protein
MFTDLIVNIHEPIQVDLPPSTQSVSLWCINSRVMLLVDCKVTGVELTTKGRPCQTSSVTPQASPLPCADWCCRPGSTECVVAARVEAELHQMQAQIDLRHKSEVHHTVESARVVTDQ